MSKLVPENTPPIEVLHFIVENNFAPKNITDIASGERNFSKLKLIKTYLRSTMAETRLEGLAMISIEHEIGQKLDYADLISDFANMKARKVYF